MSSKRMATSLRHFASSRSLGVPMGLSKAFCMPSALRGGGVAPFSGTGRGMSFRCILPTDQGTSSKKQGTEDRDQGAGNKQQGTEGTGSREQGLAHGPGGWLLVLVEEPFS